MTAARDQRDTIPAWRWDDPNGDALILSEVYTGTNQQLIRTAGGATVALTSTELRELASQCIDRAEVMDNVPGRNRRTWRWHVRQGERLLSQSLDNVRADLLVQQAQAHFQAAAVLRGTTTVHIHHKSGKDTE